MFIEYADQALEHFTLCVRHLPQRDLGRQLTAKVALLIGDRMRIDLAEELGLQTGVAVPELPWQPNVRNSATILTH